jgi:hypothetical protein
MNLLDDFKRFVTDAQSGSQYTNWAAANPSESARWKTFRDAILAGQRPAPPTMTTAHGRELIDAGVLYLDASLLVPQLRVTITGKPQVGALLRAAIV